MHLSYRIILAGLAPLVCFAVLRPWEGVGVGKPVPDTEAALYVAGGLPHICCNPLMRTSGLPVSQSPMSSPALSEAETAWRSPGRSGLNALYTFLRLSGADVAYPQLEAELSATSPQPSFLDLRRIAERFGVPVTIRRLRPDEINRSPMPVLTLMEDSVDKASYAVIGEARRGESWLLFDGGTAQVLHLTDDEFHRYWSGVALLPEKRSHPWSVSLTIVFAGLLGYALLRVPSLTRSNNRIPSFSGTFPACLVLLLLPQTGSCMQVPAGPMDQDETLLPATKSAADLRRLLAGLNESIKSISIVYQSLPARSVAEGVPGSYLHRAVAANSGGEVYYLNTHGLASRSWEADLFSMRCLATGGRGVVTNPLTRTFFSFDLAPEDPAPWIQDELFFMATGIWPFEKRPEPTWLGTGVPCTLRSIARNERYAVVWKRMAWLNGRWCHILEAPKLDRWWIDVERGGTVMAREFFDRDGTLIQRFELGEHKEAAPGIWMPGWIRNLTFDSAAPTPRGKLRKVKDRTLRVLQAQVNRVPESLFVFEPPPGALRLTNETPIQVRPGGKDEIEDVLAAMQDHAGVRAGQSSHLALYLAVALGVALVLAGWEAWLRTRR